MPRKINGYTLRPQVADGGMRCTHTSVITGRCNTLLKKGVIAAMAYDHKGKLLSECKCYKHNKAGIRRDEVGRIGKGNLTRSVGG